VSAEIQPADPRLRTRWLVLLTLAAALGAIGLLSLDGYLKELHGLASQSPAAAATQARGFARAILAAIAAGGVLLSLVLARDSWRTLRTERYPPPGARVLSDTRIRHGRAARRRGQAGLALSVLTLLLTVFIVARAHRVFSHLLETRLKPTPINFERPRR
jgi:hypothetical protein